MSTQPTSRKVASVKTAITGIIMNVVITLLGFIVQKIFIDSLGVEYNGIKGVFTSIVSVITLADLGVGTAIIFHLYKPLHENNKKVIASLISYYHKVCRILTIVVLAVGLAIMPFLSFLIGDHSIPDNVYIIFVLFIIKAAMSYILAHRRPLLQADQKGYIINLITTLSSILLYGLQIVVLITTRNFYLFIACMIIAKLIENIVLNQIAKYRYPYTTKYEPLAKNTKTDIIKKIKGSAFHNASSYVIYSTDNIIISTIFGITTVGIYTNYSMILNALQTLVDQIFSSMSASFGNLLVSDGVEKTYRIFRRTSLLAFWIYSSIAIATYFCVTSFITMWIGEEFLLPNVVVGTLVLNFFIRGMRLPINNVIAAAGIIYENRYMPVAEAIINLIASIALANWIGLPGVFIGTVISNIFLHVFSYPKYGFKLVFQRKKVEYILLFIKNLLIFVVAWTCVWGTMHLISIDNLLLEFIVKGAVSIIIPSVLYLIIFHRTDDFKYFVSLTKKLIRR